MKKLLILFLAACMALPALAQLQLRQLNGTQTRKIGPDSEITVRLNTPSSLQSKETYHDYTGRFLGFRGDSIEMEAKLESRYYADEQGLFKLVSVNYCCPPGQDAVFAVPAAQVLSVQKGNPDILRGVGGLVLMATFLHSVATAPMLNNDARRTSDKIVLGGAVLGLGLVILPRKKSYHLAASPKTGVKRWRIEGR